MNKTLIALMTKLNWQHHDLLMQLQEIAHHTKLLRDEIQELEYSIQQSGTSSLQINPDIEINRLNFFTQQHLKKEELRLLLQDKQSSEQTLTDKLQRIKTELRMLEKYQEREQLSLKNQQIKQQQNNLDEWVVQKRGIA